MTTRLSWPKEEQGAWQRRGGSGRKTGILHSHTLRSPFPLATVSVRDPHVQAHPLQHQKPRPRSRCLAEHSFPPRTHCYVQNWPSSLLPQGSRKSDCGKGWRWGGGWTSEAPQANQGCSVGQQGAVLRGCILGSTSAGDRRRACRARCQSCPVTQQGGCCPFTFPRAPPMNNSQGPSTASHASPPSKPVPKPSRHPYPSSFSVVPTLS